MTDVKRNLGKALIGLGMFWIAVVAIFHIWAIALMWRDAGFGAVRESLSPFNIGQWIFVALTFAPGVIAHHFGDKLKAQNPAAPKIEDREPPD